jgi:hypothetical protein
MDGITLGYKHILAFENHLQWQTCSSGPTSAGGPPSPRSCEVCQSAHSLPWGPTDCSRAPNVLVGLQAGG